MRERLHIYQPRSLRSISLVHGKDNTDTSVTDDVAGIAGVMLYATVDRLIGTSTPDFSSGFTFEAFSVNKYSRKTAEVFGQCFASHMQFIYKLRHGGYFPHKIT